MTLGGSNSIEAGQLKALITRIEALHEQRKSLAADIADIYAEAKSSGYDPKIMRAVVRLRAKDPAERTEEEELIDLYMTALKTPLAHVHA